MSISTYLDNDLNSKIANNNVGINHFRDQILLTDEAKSHYDMAINNVDNNLFSQVDNVNNYLVGVQSAYQARITVGCRTDIFWRVVGIDTTNFDPEYTIQATKLSLSGYDTQPGGIGTVGMGTTGTVVLTSLGIATVSNLYGYQDDNLYGLKYYDEPYIRDIGNTTVATFIGTCSFGSNKLTVMLPYSSGISSSFKIGQLVTCDKTGIFAGTSNTIVGLGTTVANLTRVGLGSTSATVPLILLNTVTIGVATAPQPDGSFVTFTVLDDPSTVRSVSNYQIPFTQNPFSPQVIGIINNKSQVGIGISIFLDNSGNPKGPQSWNPEQFVQGVSGIPDVTEPPIGAGKIYYPIAFIDAPAVSGNRAAEGTVVAGVTELTASSYFTGLSSCPTQEVAIATSISLRDAAESQFSSGISTFSLLLDATNKLRVERDDLNLRIWGLRQTIGQQIDIINRQQTLKNYLGIGTVRGVIQ